APRRPKARAVARPTPAAAPVMTTVFVGIAQLLLSAISARPVSTSFFLRRCAGGCVTMTSKGRPHIPFQEMPADDAAVRLPEHGVDVQCRLAVRLRDIADQ